MGEHQLPRVQLLINGVPERAYNVGNTANMIWRPADMLLGSLDITCPQSFEISKGSISLEGISRNWVTISGGNGINLDIAKAERKFLTQTLDILPSVSNGAMAPPGSFCLSVPFHFIISERLPTSNPDTPDHFLQIPPSIELGVVHTDVTSGKRYAQPSISYQLNASVCFAGQDEDSNKCVETLRPIIISSYTKEFPPTDTMDFPAEFILEVSKPLRWSMIGRTFGKLAISMKEPRPLMYNLDSVHASTEVCLDLKFNPSDNDGLQSLHKLQMMTYEIRSLIRVKTFYSVTVFPTLPSQSSLGVHGGTRMRDDIIKLEKRELSHISWDFKYATVDSSASTLVGDANAKLHGLLRDSNVESPPKGQWMASIIHPIRLNSRLLPTFCSSIVARLYTIILRFKVLGARKESFDLEVPLQVVHLSPDGVADADNLQAYPITGPVGEDPASLEFRRASATSWFSDVAHENEGLPPHYQP